MRQADLANQSLPDRGKKFPRLGVGAIHHGLDEKPPAGFRCGEKLPGLSSRGSEWFFAKHVFPGSKGSKSPLNMILIRQGHIHGINIGTLQKGGITGTGRSPKFRGQCLRPCQGPRGDRRKGSGLRERQLGGEAAGNHAGAEDAPTKRW